MDLKKIDFNKIKAGIVIPTGVGLVIVLLDVIIRAIIGLLKESVEVIAQFDDFLRLWYVSIPISLLGYLFFLGLFMWTGYRTSRKYKADATEAGITAALAYAIIAVVYLLFTVILIGLQYAGVGDFTTISYGIGHEVSNILLQSSVGIVGIPCCTAGLIPLGMLINFVAGAAGAIISEKKG